MKASLERRVRQLRSRALVRAWDYRQLRHARGTWFRLRRVLADAAEAYAVSPEVARQLLDAGWRPEPVGEQLQPAKVIVFVTPERLAEMPARRRVAVRLGAELLEAAHLVLVRFPYGRA
jgi:hypothetical protein